MTDECYLSDIKEVRRNSVADILRRTAMRDPRKRALVDGEISLTFAEFDSAVDRCAGSLAQRGLSKGDKLALLSHNCWQFAVISFAAARLGLVLVPINFMLGPDEVAYILENSRVSGVISEYSLVETAERAGALNSNIIKVRGCITRTEHDARMGWENVCAWISAAVGRNTWVKGGVLQVIDDDDPLRIMYTSGTEAYPKGVVLTSRSLMSQYVSCAIDGGMSSDDIEVHALPMYHCAQLDCFFSVDVYLGATSVILSSPEPARLLATIESERATKLFAPPTVWISLLRHPDFNNRDLTSLKKAYYGASPMPVEIVKEIATRLPQIKMWNFYGQTEMSPVASVLGPKDQLVRAGSAGRPALNVETRVVDEFDNDVPRGEIGEIVHRSPHAALGYYNDPKKTAVVYRNGWFHSGDLGRFEADGFLTVVDRKKDMIKTGGENVSSREVEEAIYGIDGVAEVAVFGVPHPVWIEAVTAVVVVATASNLTAADVLEHVRHVLAGFKRPKFVIITDSLPKNPSGKILKKDLRVKYAGIGSNSSPHP